VSGAGSDPGTLQRPGLDSFIASLFFRLATPVATLDRGLSEPSAPPKSSENLGNSHQSGTLRRSIP
jgi:hypothetical protein